LKISVEVLEVVVSWLTLLEVEHLGVDVLWCDFEMAPDVVLSRVL
jgi:hypothetical protein